MRIIATTGPLKGADFPIGELEFTIGRQADADATLEDDLVSRRHCTIQLHNGRPVVRDLDSRNGTFVNGESIQRKTLRNRDVLKVGSSTFIYKERDDVEELAPEFADDERDRARNITTLRAERAEPLFPNTESLQIRILEAVFERIAGTEHAAILLVDRNRDEFVSAMHRPSPAAISRKIAHQVIQDGLPILSHDIDSVLCVPLIVAQTKIGVVYAASCAPAAFDENHLRDLNGIARLASAGFEPTRYVEWLEDENRRLQQEITIQHELIGQSPKIRAVYDFIQKVAPGNASVLILGQSGTGKELVARAIHRNSRRADRPFIAVNCAAITESLLESELFGHEKGAFTGATMQRKGKIEVADGGTLFLDEVGELSMRMQAALLRVLQEREFERVGGTRTIKVDVRIIAATNRDLKQRVTEGHFREDLYFRLDVFSIKLPPLSERADDIPLLVDHFMRKHGRSQGVSGITPEALRLVLSYHWPGNIRELGNAIERAAGLGSSDLIRPEDLPEEVRERKAPISAKAMSYHDQINEAKRRIIDDALRLAHGSYPEAAALLDIHWTYLYRLSRTLYDKQSD
jgi:transcriptional regulator with GAF, ATPase, and Fis domain